MKFKKFLTIEMIVVFSMFTVLNESSILTVYAEEIDEQFEPISQIVQTNGYDLIENYNEDSDLCKKLEEEVDNSTEILDSDIEEKLNKVGIFDEEIEEFSEELIELLNNGVNYNIYIEYSEVNDDGNRILMNPDSVDEIIYEKYYEDSDIAKTDSQGQETENIATYTLSSSDTTNVETNKGKLKQTVMALQNSSSNRVYIYYCASWIETPSCRSQDVCGVSVGGARPVYNTIGGSTSFVNGANKYTFYFTNSDHDGISITKDISGVAVNINLWGNTDFKVILYYYAEIDNKQKGGSINVIGQYYHAKYNVSVKPSISFSGSGAGFSLSPSIEKNYEQVVSNPGVTYYYK